MVYGNRERDFEMINDQVTDGSDNPDFVRLAGMIESAYHNDFTTTVTAFSEAASTVPKDVLVNGRVNEQSPAYGDTRHEKDIVAYATSIGKKVISKYRSEESIASKSERNVGNAIVDTQSMQKKVDSVIRVLETAHEQAQIEISLASGPA